MSYIAWYCYYDPDNYHGHRKVTLKAQNMEDAEKEVFELLNRSMFRGVWEYQIFEVSNQSGPRVYDIDKKERA